jgi:hypothetical protein
MLPLGLTQIEWAVFEETWIARTGWVLPTASLHAQATTEQLGRQQPDWVLVAKKLKNIAIQVVDLCLASASHPPAKLLAAAMQKQHAYCPHDETLSYYADQGWITHVFTGVVDFSSLNPS